MTVGDSFRSVAAALSAAEARAGRRAGETTLIAVSKRHPASAVVEAYHAGARDFGESYVQEMAAKREEVAQLLGADADEIRWHFIGHLQRNKVRGLGRVHLVHTVDSLRLLHTIDARGPDVGGVLVQVNIGGEGSKAGLAPAEVGALLAGAASRATAVQGLMTIPPRRATVDLAREDFATLRRLRDELRTEETPLPHLSMGMSSDFEVAVAQGATLVRVGTAIFGART